MTKKGTDTEIQSINGWLHRVSLKYDGCYADIWHAMCFAAAQKASKNCRDYRKILRDTKIDAFCNLCVSTINQALGIQLSILSTAFVVVNIMKTFDIKLGTVGRGNLNMSHSVAWVQEIQFIHKYVTSSQQTRQLQYMDNVEDYNILTDDQLNKLKLLISVAALRPDDSLSHSMDRDDGNGHHVGPESNAASL